MGNRIELEIQNLLSARQYGDARHRLQNHLLAGDIRAGLDERPWVGLAIAIARAILHRDGAWPPAEDAERDTLAFWDTLLTFFLDELEPQQKVRSHKGTLYFQRGLFQLRPSLDDALDSFRLARHEDEQTARDRGEPPDQVEHAACHNDAHTVLAFLELLGRDNLDDTDRAGFVYYIFSGAFGAEIHGQPVDASRMEQALSCLSYRDLARTRDTYRELVCAADSGLSRASVVMAGVTLESVLLDILRNGVGLSHVSGNRPIDEVTLGVLFPEADRQCVFASDPIRASLRMIYLLRNRLHPGNESRQNYRLTPRIGMLARKLLEGTLCFWHEVLVQRGQSQPVS